MVCYSPITAWRGRFLTARGKRPLVFSRNKALNPHVSTAVPCGQCVGCRLEYSRQWAVRCAHEMRLYDDNCFITLTYDEAHLLSPVTRGIPAWRRLSVNRREMQLFMKRLRKRYGAGIRVFGCGEYGDKLGRPHYHALLFNHRFEDMKRWKQSSSGEMLYRSAELEKLWPFGFSSVGAATFQSAAYVARYMMKKVRGDLSQKAYAPMCCPSTGEIMERSPEFAFQSQSLGKKWFQKFGSDVYPKDHVVMDTVPQKPPKFYDGLAEDIHEYHIERIKKARKRAALAKGEPLERLRVRERVQEQRVALLARSVD